MLPFWLCYTLMISKIKQQISIAKKLEHIFHVHMFCIPRCIWTSVLNLIQKYNYPWSSCLSSLPPIRLARPLGQTQVVSLGLRVTATSLHLCTHRHILVNSQAQAATAVSTLSRSLSMGLQLHLIRQWDSIIPPLPRLHSSKRDQLRLMRPFTPQFRTTANTLWSF